MADGDAGAGGRDARASGHLLYLLWRVQHGADDHDPVQQVRGDPVRRADVLRPSDGRERIIINHKKNQTNMSFVHENKLRGPT